MKKIFFTLFIMLLPVCGIQAKGKQKTTNDREYWVNLLCQMAEPVLKNMSQGTLQKNMRLEVSPNWDGRNKRVAYMECFGRLMAGVAPWLTLPDDHT